MARWRSTIFSRWVPSRCRSSVSVSRTSPRGAIASSIESKTIELGFGPMMRAIPHISKSLSRSVLSDAQLGVVGGLQFAARKRVDAQMPRLALVDDIELACRLTFKQQPG